MSVKWTHYVPNGWTTQRFNDRNRRNSYSMNWHFGGDGARHGLKTARPANTSGTSWFWNYTHKRWEIYVLGGVSANLVVASVR